MIPDSIIIPPPDIKTIVDKTADFVARNGIAFEEKLKENEKANPKFTFLFPQDAYNCYYQWKISFFKDNKEEIVVPEKPQPVPQVQVLQAPPQFQFLCDVPPISPRDYDIMKTTALFAAKNPKFTSLLKTKEKRSAFDFLKSTHPLNAFFSKLVVQYQKIISQTFLKAKSKRELLEQITNRVQYAQWLESQRKKAVEERDKERISFATIDWHDFVVVESIDVTDQDQETDLPPPTTLVELQKATMELRRKNLKLGELDVVRKRRKQEETQICPRCGEHVPLSEIEEHVRIELLDPKWSQQKKTFENLHRESNLTKGTQIIDSLNQFAEYRTDIFTGDEELFRQKIEMDKERQKQESKHTWDGHK